MLKKKKNKAKTSPAYILFSKMTLNQLITVCVLNLLTFSCIPHRKVTYMQEAPGKGEVQVQHKKMQYKIRPQDNLHIAITSLNPQVSEFFNLKSEGDKETLKGYTVNDSGYIYMPVLDSVKVKDMTISEIQYTLQKTIREHVTDATVIVRLASFNIVVLGEVASPGLLSYDGEELTIIKAIGLAGDISDFGNKKKVRLIRKEGNASKFVTLDLTSRDILSSEYYYLNPEDVIYVEALRAKNYRLNVGQLSLIVGLASFVLLVINAVK